MLEKQNLNSKTLEESKKYIQYWIYDLPSHTGTFKERYEALKNMNLPECCVLVESTVSPDEKHYGSI